MPLPVEFVVLGTPRSAQAKPRSKQRWKRQVAGAAQGVWTEPPVTSEVMVKIVYYYEGSALDTDNLIKPIQDALCGIVYVDDCQVTDVRSGKRSLDGSYRIRGLSSELARGFESDNEFVHVRVEEAPDPQELI